MSHRFASHAHLMAFLEADTGDKSMKYEWWGPSHWQCNSEYILQFFLQSKIYRTILSI